MSSIKPVTAQSKTTMAAASSQQAVDVASGLCAVAVMPDLLGAVLPGVTAWAQAVAEEEDGHAAEDKVRGAYRWVEPKLDEAMRRTARAQICYDIYNLNIQPFSVFVIFCLLQLSTALLTSDFLPLLLANCLRSAPPADGPFDALLTSALTSLLTPLPSQLEALVEPHLPPDLCDVISQPTSLAADGGSEFIPGAVVGAACASAAASAVVASVRRIIDALGPLIREEQQHQQAHGSPATTKTDRLGRLIDVIASSLTSSVRSFVGGSGQGTMAAAAALSALRARVALAETELEGLPDVSATNSSSSEALRCLLQRRDAAASLASAHTAAARVALAHDSNALTESADQKQVSEDASSLEAALSQLSLTSDTSAAAANSASSSSSAASAAMTLLGLTPGQQSGGSNSNNKGKLASAAASSAAAAAEASAAAALASVRREVDAVTAGARTAHNAAAARQAALTSRRAELLAELERVTSALGEATTDVSRTSAALEAATAPFAARLAAAEAAHSRAAAALARVSAAGVVRKEVRNLAQALAGSSDAASTAALPPSGSPTSAISAATAGASGSSSAVSIPGSILSRAARSIGAAASDDSSSVSGGAIAPLTVTPLLTSLHRYLTSEEALTHAIASRAASARASAAAMTSEARQYRGLGLSTVASDVEKRAKQLIADAEEDEASVAALRRAAAGVVSDARTAVLDRLTAAAAHSNNSHKLSPSQIGWLHRIRASAGRCGLLLTLTSSGGQSTSLTSWWPLPPNTDPRRAAYEAELTRDAPPAPVITPAAATSTGSGPAGSAPVTATNSSRTSAPAPASSASGGSSAAASRVPSGGVAPKAASSSPAGAVRSVASSSAGALGSLGSLSAPSSGSGSSSSSISALPPTATWGDMALAAAAASSSSASSSSAAAALGVGARGASALSSTSPRRPTAPQQQHQRAGNAGSSPAKGRPGSGSSSSSGGGGATASPHRAHRDQPSLSSRGGGAQGQPSSSSGSSGRPQAAGSPRKAAPMTPAKK